MLPLRLERSRRISAAALASLLLVPLAGCSKDGESAPVDQAEPQGAVSDNSAPPAPSGDAPGEPSNASYQEPPGSQPAEQRESFPEDRLEQMVAPIALYPDPLLTDLLMAATYPAEVAEAAAWVKQHPGLNGKELDDAIADKGWDVSVNSLAHAPQAIELMGADPQWTKDLGDAFLAQQDDVLNAVQVMRNKACDLNHLKTTEQQKVVIEPAQPRPAVHTLVPPPQNVVSILPAYPETFYVPIYNPVVVFGPPPPVIFYPGIYAYPAISVSVAPVISFGVGLAIGGLIWGDLDWHHHHCCYSHRWYGGDHYSGDYYGGGGYYGNRFASAEPWRHDWNHRRGVVYRDH